MKQKIILILTLLFLLSGCEAKYELAIDNDLNFNEQLTINNYAKETWNNSSPSYQKLISDNYNYPIPVNVNIPGYLDNNTKIKGYDYYDKTLINESNNYGVHYNYTFSQSSYPNSMLANYGFRKISIVTHNDKLYINASNPNDIFTGYPLFEQLTIVINSNYLVEKNNADKVSNNLYYWYFTKDNYQDKKIEYIADYSQRIKESEVTTQNTIYLLIFFGIILIGGIFIFIKVKKSNQ